MCHMDATEDPRKAAGRALRDARVALGYRSQVKAATAAGVSPASWGALETGNNDNFLSSTLNPAEDLVGWERGTYMKIRTGQIDPPNPRRRATPSPSGGLQEEMGRLREEVRLLREEIARQGLSAGSLRLATLEDLERYDPTTDREVPAPRSRRGKGRDG